MDLITSLQAFTASLPAALQFLGIGTAALVPFVEGEGAAVIGAVTGVNPWVAVPVAILANVAVVVLIVLSFERLRSMFLNRRLAAGKSPRPVSARQQKVRTALERYGVPGVSLLGPFLLPTHFTAAALTSLGVAKVRVIAWQTIAITLYATVVGALGYAVIGAVL